MICLPERKRRILLFTIVIVLSVVGVSRTEVYPEDAGRKTYIQDFGDLGTLVHLWRRPEHAKFISELRGILQIQTYFGTNKVAPESSQNSVKTSSPFSIQIQKRVKTYAQTSDNRRNRVIKSAHILKNSQKLAQNQLYRDKRAVTDKTETNETDEVIVLSTSAYSGASSSSTREDVPTSPPVQTSQCVLDTQRVFTGVNNGDEWSLKFLDSWGKPGAGLLRAELKFVGSYQECLTSMGPPDYVSGSDGFSGIYCAVGMAAPIVVGGQNIMELLAQMPSIEIGACLPSTCSAQDVFSLFSQGLASANLSQSLFVTAVDCRNDEREYTAATIASIILLSIIGIFMLLGTAYDVLFVQGPKWVESKRINDLPVVEPSQLTNGYEPIGGHSASVSASFLVDGDKQRLANEEVVYSEAKTGAIPVPYSEGVPLLRQQRSQRKRGEVCLGILTKVLLSFSVYTNGKKLLNTSQPAGALGAIHGIRFLSMSWVILGHSYIFSIASFGNLATAMPTLLSRWTFDAVSNALVSVDTFFALSGLLLSYLTTKEMQKKGWKLNWAMFYFHRFWRLTPPYMLVLVTALGLHRFLGSGSMWSSVQPQDKTFCENNWWTNILYINNFIRSREMCLAHSWYLANDMQFYIISPLMIVPFYFNLYAGLGSCFLFLIVNWITTGVLSATNNWPPSLIKSSLGFQIDGTLDYQHYYYYAPYCRIGPFVIGILAGYLLSVTKGRINVKWYYVILGWAAAISVGLASVYGIHGDITGDKISSVGVSAFYNAVARSAWGASVCWVIVACVCGYGGPVNAILSWSPFVSLGRLTYMAYLIHPTVIRVYFSNMDQTFYLNDTNFVISYLGLLIFTNMASFVLVLGFESPMIGLEKVFFGRH